MTDTVFIPTKDMAEVLGVSPKTLKTWRLGDRKKGIPPRLTQGAHWTYLGPQNVRFHRALMLDFMANQHAPELHQKAVEAYLASLLSSKAVG